MIKVVLDEICAELDADNSGTIEKNEISEYAEKMLLKLRPKAEFSHKTFDSNFNRLDTFDHEWV